MNNHEFNAIDRFLCFNCRGALKRNLIFPGFEQLQIRLKTCSGT